MKFSFFLVNLHVLVVFPVVAEHYLAGRVLTYFDLWFGVFFSLVYVLFYLIFLDPKVPFISICNFPFRLTIVSRIGQGVHLYIFLSPRTHLSPLIHALACSLHVLIFSLLRERVLNQKGI